jgi:hypothetical protein
MPHPNIKAWKLCERAMGKTLTNRLRMGKSIQIAASNGMTYELDRGGTVYNLTTGHRFCVHPDVALPTPDHLYTLYEWIRLRPEVVERRANKHPDRRR